VIRLSGMNLIINDTDHPLIIKVASIPSARLQVYFIDNDEYFKRKADLVDDKGALFPDNDERSIFFVRGVLETVKKLGWVPDIIHCHGWMSALMPAYVKEFYKNDPHFANSKVVYSLYGNGFEGSLDKDLKKKLAFDGLTDRALNLIGEPTHTNLTKLAVEYADGVIYGTSNVPDEVKLHAASTETVCIDCVDEDRVVGEITNFYDSILQGNPALVEE
jgi:starch synthase